MHFLLKIRSKAIYPPYLTYAIHMQGIGNCGHFHPPRRASINGVNADTSSMEQQPTIRSDVLQFLERNHPAEHAIWQQRIDAGEAKVVGEDD